MSDTSNIVNESCVYMDFNAITPVADEVRRVIDLSLEKFWHNPSSSHRSGQIVKQLMNESRSSISKLINSKSPEELIFVSSGTEANFMVFNTFQSLNYRNIYKRKVHVVTTTTEHPSVLVPLRNMELDERIDLSVVPVNPHTGVVDSRSIVKELKPERINLVSVMLANNETGAINPVEDIVREVHLWDQRLEQMAKRQQRNRITGLNCPFRRVYVHSDMAQAIGKLPVDVMNLGVDYGTIVGQKFYGPRIACLYVRGLRASCVTSSIQYRNVSMTTPIVPLFYGGGQESGYRSGTENSPLIMGLGKASELAQFNLHENVRHMHRMRILLEQELEEAFRGIKSVKLCIFGVHRCCSDETQVKPKAHQGKWANKRTRRTLREQYIRLPNTVNMTLVGPPWLDSHRILNLCPNLHASRGAACHSALDRSIHMNVLQACGYSSEQANSAIRLSLGRQTNEHEVIEASRMIGAAVQTILDEM